MSDPTTRFYFPTAPQEYNQEFMNELVRSFSLFQEQLKNPGKLTAHSLNLKPHGTEGIKQYSNNREAYDDGLLPGDIWMLSTGEIRVVIDPNIDVPVSIPYYSSGKGEVGSVTAPDGTAEIGDIINPMELQVGSITLAYGFDVTGVTATGETPDIADGVTIANVTTTVQLSGVEATTSVERPNVDSDDSVALGSVSAEGQIGSIELSLGTGFDVSAPDAAEGSVDSVFVIYGVTPTGSVGTASVGSVTVTAPVTQAVTGITALGFAAEQADDGWDILVDGESVY